MSAFNSLALIPGDNPPSSVSVGGSAAASSSSEFGVHDTLRNGLLHVKKTIQGQHPLEQRLSQWEETRSNLQMSMYRQTFGLSAPIQLQMERMLVKNTENLIPVTKQHNLGLDILMGRDDTIEFEDYLGNMKTPLISVDPHAAMERKLKL